MVSHYNNKSIFENQPISPSREWRKAESIAKDVPIMGAFESFMIFLLLSQCNLFSNMPARFLFIVFSTKLWSFVKYIITIFVWLSELFFPWSRWGYLWILLKRIFLNTWKCSMNYIILCCHYISLDHYIIFNSWASEIVGRWARLDRF